MEVSMDNVWQAIRDIIEDILMVALTDSERRDYDTYSAAFTAILESVPAWEAVYAARLAAWEAVCAARLAAWEPEYVGDAE